MFDFKLYADEPSIIHEVSSKGCPPDILLHDIGEICETCLRGEYPQCRFFTRKNPSCYFFKVATVLVKTRFTRFRTML